MSLIKPKAKVQRKARRLNRNIPPKPLSITKNYIYKLTIHNNKYSKLNQNNIPIQNHDLDDDDDEDIQSHDFLPNQNNEEDQDFHPNVAQALDQLDQLFGKEETAQEKKVRITKQALDLISKNQNTSSHQPSIDSLSQNDQLEENINSITKQ